MGIVAIVALFGCAFLCQSFLIWLSAKIIRAPGGNWAGCVKLTWATIFIAGFLGVGCFFVATSVGPSGAALLLVVGAVIALYYLIRLTMDVLEIGFLFFILLCLVHSAIGWGVVFAFKTLDGFVPLMASLNEVLPVLKGF